MKMPMLFVALLAFLQSPAPVRTIGKGPTSAIDEPRQVTVRSEADWAALWKENGAGGPLPAVDFSREMVVGVFAGTRPTAGYGVEIVRAVDASGTLIVDYVETAPGRDRVAAQILTAPFHLVAIPKHEGMVTFRKVER
jgi:protease stability complex PrcB-like protein